MEKIFKSLQKIKCWLLGRHLKKVLTWREAGYRYCRHCNSIYHPKIAKGGEWVPPIYHLTI